MAGPSKVQYYPVVFRDALSCTPALARGGRVILPQQEPEDETVRDQEQRYDDRHEEVGTAQPADLVRKTELVALVEPADEIGAAP